MGGLHKHHCGTGLSFRRIGQAQHPLLALPAQVTCSSRRPKAAELLMGDFFTANMQVRCVATAPN